MRGVLLLVPVLTLVFAYAALAVDQGTIWLWDCLIHESGARSFRDTVFYFDHALREIPVDFFLALTIGVAARRGRTKHRAAWGALVVFLGILIGAVMTTSPEHCIEEFAQSRTRQGVPPDWGSHWQYHLLSRLSLMIAALGVLAVFQAGDAYLLRRNWPRLILVFAGFAAATLLYRARSEPFVDARYLGHQAREFVTHALVTVPLALCMVIPRTAKFRWNRTATLLLCLAAMPALWCGVGAVVSEAAGQAQTSSIARIIGGHFFEHALGYLFVPLMAAAVAGSPAAETMR